MKPESPPQARKLRLGEMLIASGAVSMGALDEALSEQRASGRKLGKILIDKGFVTETALATALASQMRLDFVDLRPAELDPEICRLLPEVHARRLRALPVRRLGRRTHDRVLVGFVDPTDINAFDEAERLMKCPVEPAVIEESKLLAAIDKVYRRTEEITGLARELQQELAQNEAAFDTQRALLSARAEDAPVVRLLQSLLDDAVRVRASDIHIEPMETVLVIRFRIDGVLHVQTETDNKIAPALVMRLKIMSGLDISEKRLPQDGRFVAQIGGGLVDIRLSTLPTHYGESVVMRLLPRGSQMLSLGKLGLPDSIREELEHITNRSQGMVLVTGPTGSGKTTTLYSMLSRMNSPERKVMTAEDPVEYRLHGINHVQVNERIGLTFAAVLRSMLRQDPDVVLIGEMRDAETVETGLRAAITGHMVLSSLHTNDAASAPLRLVDMGAPPYMVGMSLQVVIAQRLVRRVCKSCAAQSSLAAREQAWLERVEIDPDRLAGLRAGKGCADCNDTGYSGRIGAYEMLRMDDDLVRSLAHDGPAFAVEARRRMAGHSLRDHALQLALNGQTTLAEVLRIEV